MSTTIGLGHQRLLDCHALGITTFLTTSWALTRSYDENKKVLRNITKHNEATRLPIDTLVSTWTQHRALVHNRIQ